MHEPKPVPARTACVIAAGFGTRQRPTEPRRKLMPHEWSNWSGSLRFTPGRIAEPASEEELASLVRRAAGAGQSVRVVGAGHSSSPLVKTEDVLVSLSRFNHVIAHDRENCEATIGGGTTLHQAGKELLALGMAFDNLGDVDEQTVAGAIGTGTHGTGVQLSAIPSHLIGGRCVTGCGDIIEFQVESNPEFVHAVRVSLGVQGIITALRLRLVPAHKLRKREWCARTDDCLNHFPALAVTHRHVDFYWYPRSDEAKIRTADVVDAPAPDLPFARLLAEEMGWSSEVIPNTRELRFEEMEYAVPIEDGLPCFREVRQRIKDRWRHFVGWRVLYRTVAADDAFFSPAHGRQTATISLHQNATLPFWDFFRDIEPIFRAYGGRPHWGKQHTLRAADLRPLYPQWDRFLDIRHSRDPEGVFLTPYLRQLLGVA